MPRYVIPLTTYASTAVEFDTDLTDPEEILDALWDTQPDMPTLCNHCTGGRGGSQSLDLGDEWEVVRTADGRPEIRAV